MVGRMNTIITVGCGERHKTLSLLQMQQVAQRNGLESHALYGEKQDLAGLKVVAEDLGVGHIAWDAEHLQSLAAQVGATVQHPGGADTAAFPPGYWSRNSFFVYPSGGITPHKGGRIIKKSTDVTPETAAILRRLSDLGVSLGDLVEEAARQKLAELGDRNV